MGFQKIKMRPLTVTVRHHVANINYALPFFFALEVFNFENNSTAPPNKSHPGLHNSS